MFSEANPGGAEREEEKEIQQELQAAALGFCPGWDGGPKIESNGNLRTSAASRDPGSCGRLQGAAQAPAHTGLKKKGNVSNCAHATISSEKAQNEWRKAKVICKFKK